MKTKGRMIRGRTIFVTPGKKRYELFGNISLAETIRLNMHLILNPKTTIVVHYCGKRDEGHHIKHFIQKDSYRKDTPKHTDKTRHTIDCTLVACHPKDFMNEAVIMVSLSSDGALKAQKFGILYNAETKRFILYVITVAEGSVFADEYTKTKDLSFKTHYPVFCHSDIENALSSMEVVPDLPPLPKQAKSNTHHLRLIRTGSTAVNITYDPFIGKGYALTFQNEYRDYAYSFIKKNGFRIDIPNGKKLHGFCPIVYEKSSAPPIPTKPSSMRFTNLFGHLSEVPIIELVKITGAKDHSLVEKLQQVRA